MNLRTNKPSLLALVLALTFTATPRAAEPSATTAPAADAPISAAADDETDLAKKLSNPVAGLISLPFQSNFDFGGGPKDNAFRYTLNVQPVVPFQLSENWNLISRTIIPFVHQEKVFGSTTQSGLSDIAQSLFFSPAKPGPGGIIWGAGPVFLLPTATDDRLGTEKFGLGPTAVVLTQAGGWTYGALANHIWSVAGNDSRRDVNATLLNPFVSYQLKTQTTLGVSTEPVYDWQSSRWTVPLAASVSQLVKIGKLPVSFTLGGRYYAEKPDGGPDWGLRFAVTFLFPK